MLRRKVLSLAATALGFVISSVAVAQDATTPPPAAPPATTPPPAAPPPADSAVVGEAPVAAPATGKAAEERTEEIVVTGTRIRRKDLTTPAPVSVVNRDALTNSGKVSLGDFLQSLPEQGNTVNTQVNNGNDGSVHVSLRSLGAVRTLVLVNGRRMVAGGTQDPTAAPDLNTIPAAAIERVEILKDGGSAVYGSDAIAGVVNVILKKKYSGSEASTYGGVTGHTDGETFDLSAMTGTGSERGNLLFSVGYQEQKSVMAGDRKWSETTYDYDFATGAKSPTGNSSTFPNGRFTLPGLTTDADGVITGCSGTGNAQYNALCNDAVAGDVSNFVPTFNGTTTTFDPYDGTLYNTNPTNYLLTPNRRIQIFATGDTNLGDVARGFFEASYVNRTSSQDLAPMPVVNNTIPNKPVSVDAASLYNPLGLTVTTWRKRTTEFGNRHFSQDLDTFRIVAGFDGSLGDWASGLRGWQWEASYNYGRTGGSQMNQGQVRMPNLANATGPSMMDPDTNQAICVRVPGDATTVIPGCVPANMLGGEGALSSAAKDYITFTGTDRSYIQQQVYSFTLGGELFNLPTSERPLGLAVGVEHRLEGAGFQPDVITASLESSGNNQLPTQGKYDVTEGYAELSVPIFANRPGFQDLELSAAIRAFNYSTFGSDSTYKLGARWSPIRDVTLRGTFSTAFRAPNVGELYGGTQDSFDGTNGDPCIDNTAGQCAPGTAWGTVAGGSNDTSEQFLSKRSPNPNLKPETANVYTAGIVFEPRAIANLSATVDYYNINLKKTINIRQAQYILDQCYGPSQNVAMCQLITRAPTGEILQIIDTRENLGTTETQGIDFAVRYGLPTPNIGRFNLVVDGTYLIQYDETDVTGFTTVHAGNYDNLLAMPRFKANTSVLWAKGGLGAGVTARYVHSYKECASGLCTSDDSESRTVDAYLPVDLFLAYSLKSRAGTTSIAAGVQNVLDTDPPYIYNAFSANSDPSTYDYLGRFFYIRLTQAI